MREWITSFVNNNSFWAGIIAGIAIGFLPSVYAGHLGNKITERRNRKNLEGKQKKFIDKLAAATQSYITSPPGSDAEVSERRNTVATTVKELSETIFNQNSPEVTSLRPESTEYPQLPCKWCHREHKAFAGSKGECTICHLPLDFWLGFQGETHKT